MLHDDALIGPTNSKEIDELIAKYKTGVIVDGRSLTYLASFAQAYLDEYKKLLATLSEDNQEKVGFGNNKCIITIRYGTKNQRTLFAYTPALRRFNPEYIIVDEVTVTGPQGELPVPSGSGCVKNFVPNGVLVLYFGTTDKDILTVEKARSLAQEHFQHDVKTYVK